MKRVLFEAQFRNNPPENEYLPKGMGNTDIPQESEHGWGYPIETEKEQVGSVKSGVSMTQPLYDCQPKVNRKKS